MALADFGIVEMEESLCLERTLFRTFHWCRWPREANSFARRGEAFVAIHWLN